MIENMSAIDTNTEEGRFLVAAIELVKQTSEQGWGKWVDQRLSHETILAAIDQKQGEMYERAGPCPVRQGPPESLVGELSAVINRRSLDSEMDVSDYVLAEFLIGCLRTFAVAIKADSDMKSGRESAPVMLKPRFEGFFSVPKMANESTIHDYRIQKIQAIIRSMTPTRMEDLFVMEEAFVSEEGVRTFVVKSTF